MPNILAILLAILQMIAPALTQHALTRKLSSGEWLRLHVVAQDDTPEMQRVKLEVRDAVQRCYAAASVGSGPMLAQAEALLPLLRQTAEDAARAQGFDGPVDVTLGTQSFDRRELEGIPVPAGAYPALVIRLGEAAGRNWWGLLDPQTALDFAAVVRGDGPIVWDWSWEALLAALFGRPLVSGT